jgi:AcrR family transcriptional regulator
MPRTRSRANTEEKFLNATLELVAQDGCCALGINAIAHKAGADKVLIYRYFGNLDGLLHRVAECRQWLPSLDELSNALSLKANHPASGTMHEVVRLLTHHIYADKATTQILRWRKAASNPLTEHFSNEWKVLWENISDHFSTGLDYEEREGWKRATALTALTVEAELCDEPVSSRCIDHITKGLVIGQVPQTKSMDDPLLDDQLPTNLL